MSATYGGGLNCTGGAVPSVPPKTDWRWHTVPKRGKAQIACPICRKVDVAGKPIIVWKELIVGCWPCVFNLAAFTGGARRQQKS
jgi:hypothetical protein